MTEDLRLSTTPAYGRIPTELTCRECPERFSGPGMWRALSKHLKREHPRPSGGR